MSYATELHVAIVFKNIAGYELIATCPDEDHDINIHINDTNESVYQITLDEAQELGEFLIEHVKNARNQ